MTNAKQNPPGFDFGSLDIGSASEVPFEFELKHPQTGEGLGVFASVIGTESNEFQAYLRREANAARRRLFEKKRKGADDEPLSVEAEEDALLGALVVCLKGWRTGDEPVILEGGNRIEFSPETALAWLRKHRWVRAQVNEVTGDLGNFIKA